MKTSKAKSCIFMVKNGKHHENRNLAKKRAAEAMALASSQQQRPKKNRVVLGELKNLSGDVCSDDSQHQ